MRTQPGLLLALCAMLQLVPAPVAMPQEPVTADLVLKNGTVIDGTGSPRRRADVAIRGERIVAVGTFNADPKAKVIDASAWIVAPGFIDLHTHSDDGIVTARLRANRNYQAQGVTTIVTGNCGGGTRDVAKLLDAVDASGAGTNVIHLIPHGALRASVMGNADRAPTEKELERMKALVERGMKAGAWGMSTGLIYLPGRVSETPELIALSHVVARHGGFYASHIRNEGEGLLRSIDEILTIGREAKLPVHRLAREGVGEGELGPGGDPACARIRGGAAEGRADGHRRSVSLRGFEHEAGGDGRPCVGSAGGCRGLRPHGRRSRAGTEAAPRDPGGTRPPRQRSVDPDRPLPGAPRPRWEGP